LYWGVEKPLGKLVNLASYIAVLATVCDVLTV